MDKLAFWNKGKGKTPQQVINSRVGKRKKEKRTLGLTESQQDYLGAILLLIVATVYAYYKVDWEYTIFPRSLGSVVEVVPGNEDIKASTFNIHVGERRSESFAVWKDAASTQTLKASGVTLLVFHSELVDIGTQLLPRFHSETTDHRIPDTARRSVLHVIHEGLIDRVVWMTPDWSKHFYGANRTAAEYHVGLNADGELRVTCWDDYFVFKRLYSPLSSLTKAVPFHLQVLPVSAMYRRATTIPLSRALVVDIDVSYFAKQDPIIYHLRSLGLDSQRSKFLRAWQANICLDQEDPERKLANYEAMERNIATVFSKNLFELPFDIFLQRVRDTLPVMCEGRGDKVWENLHFVLHEMTPEMVKIIRDSGLPAEAGTTALPTDQQLKGMIDEMMKFLTRTGTPTPQVMTLSDDMQLQPNITDWMATNLQYHFGQHGVLQRHDLEAQAKRHEELLAENAKAAEAAEAEAGQQEAAAPAADGDVMHATEAPPPTDDASAEAAPKEEVEKS